MAEKKLTLKEQAEVRDNLYTMIKKSLEDMGEDIDFAEVENGKTKVLNLPFVFNEIEGWAEIKVILKKDSEYDGYDLREMLLIDKRNAEEKAKAKAKAKAEKIAKDKEKREAKRLAREIEKKKASEGAE